MGKPKKNNSNYKKRNASIKSQNTLKKLLKVITKVN